MEPMTKKIKLTTNVTTDVKELTWTIKDFPLVSSLDENFMKLKMEFHAGENIGLPTQWQVYFEKNYNQVGIFVELKNSPEGRAEVFGSALFKLTTDPLFQFKKLSGPQSVKNYKKDAWGCKSFIESLTNLVGPATKPSSSLVDGAIIIRIQFTLYNDDFEANTKRVDSELIRLHDDCHLALKKNLENLWESGEKADITFQLEDGQTLKAYSAILIAQSPVFAAMLETDMTEASSGIVNIEDITYGTLKTVLYFMYTCQLEEKWEENIDQIIYAADKYAISLLKETCDKTLATTCKLDNAWDTLKLAQRHGLKIAQEEIADYIESNIGKMIEATNS